MKAKAVFLDRDGTLIEDKGYICHFSQVRIFPFSVAAVRLFNRLNYRVIVISNQSSIARGICTPMQVEKIHQQLRQEFKAREAVIDHFYYCPYHPQGTVKEYRKDHDWRKPGTGMIMQAALDFDLDLNSSFVIGDSNVDIEAGKNAGCKTCLVLTGQGKVSEKILADEGIIPDFIFQDIKKAADCLSIQKI